MNYCVDFLFIYSTEGCDELETYLDAQCAVHTPIEVGQNYWNVSRSMQNESMLEFEPNRIDECDNQEPRFKLLFYS